MMACFFGWRNYCNYEPIAGQRGIPDDVCDNSVSAVKTVITLLMFVGSPNAGVDNFKRDQTLDDFVTRPKHYDA